MHMIELKQHEVNAHKAVPLPFVPTKVGMSFDMKGWVVQFASLYYPDGFLEVVLPHDVCLMLLAKEAKDLREGK